MDTTDIVIIGAGIVGLAIAAELSGRFPERSIVLFERNSKCGQETSSRNSEVIHAGIYYPRDSLKANLCITGNQMLYRFCDEHDIPLQHLGKLIVATTDRERTALEELLIRGSANGVNDLRMLGRDETARLEPHIPACAALWSPSTGTVDSHRLMSCLEGLAARNGTLLSYRHEVVGIDADRFNHRIRYNTPDASQAEVSCNWLINSAGLGAESIAALMGIDTLKAGYRLHYCKGEYFRIPMKKSQLISHLIYPPPYSDLRGLGIHVTKGLDGSIRLGPNAFYIDSPEYSVNPDHLNEFYDGVKSFLPFLEPSDLQPDTAGIRPKLQAPGMPIQDFVIIHETERTLDGVINLIGIESPGLTACLSIAATVADMLEQAGARC